MSDISNIMGEQVLRALGLNTVCMQVYLMMHSLPDADTIQIAERLDLQPAEVTDALDELADLTLVRPGLQPSSRLRPVSVERAIHTLLRLQAEQLKTQSGSLAMLQSAMKELLASRPMPDDKNGHVDVQVVSGGEAIHSAIEELSMRATESLDSLMPGGSIDANMLEAARPFDEEMRQRGLRTRGVYQNAAKGDRRTLEYVRWLADLGAEIRFAPLVPFRLILQDHASGVVIRKNPRLPSELFIIREPAILRPLIELFELSWAAAEPLNGPEPKPSDDKTPSAQELALLRLLASGSTDEAAGKKLGISVRTVRRIMADLMERLEASSRFEAGHKATQRGWL